MLTSYSSSSLSLILVILLPLTHDFLGLSSTPFFSPFSKCLVYSLHLLTSPFTILLIFFYPPYSLFRYFLFLYALLPYSLFFIPTFFVTLFLIPLFSVPLLLVPLSHISRSLIPLFYHPFTQFPSLQKLQECTNSRYGGVRHRG